jgi:hypothetical protein
MTLNLTPPSGCPAAPSSTEGDTASLCGSSSPRVDHKMLSVQANDPLGLAYLSKRGLKLASLDRMALTAWQR